MRRREFLTLAGAAAAIAPLAVRAQQSAMPIIGYLSSRGAAEDAPFEAAFLSGLNELGYVRDQSVAVESRFADNQYDRLATLAAELVRRQARILVTGGAPSAPAAAKAAKPSIPIIFVTGGDPVALGLVASLDHPGGELTGVNVLNTELSAKRLQLLHEIVPSIGIITVLINPDNPNAAAQIKEFETAARAVRSQLRVLRASTESDLDAVFATAANPAIGGLVVGSDAFFNGQCRKLGALALSHSIPAVSSIRDFAAAGGLMSYGASIAAAFRLAGHYAGRILKGEKPADLPVQQSAEVELTINLKTAKALGITVPLPLLGRADQVIE